MNETEKTPVTAVAVTVTGSEALVDASAFKAQVEEWGAKRKVLMDWIRSELIAGVDYQCIHRKMGSGQNKYDCPKKRESTLMQCPSCGAKATLCQPGAEKITGLLQLTAHFERDEETFAMLGGHEGNLCMKCQLLTKGGDIVAEGRGARSVQQDHGDINKCIKMSQKSAHVDAAKRLVAVSDIFTQDLDTMQPVEAEAGTASAAAAGVPKRKSAPPAPAPVEEPTAPPAPEKRPVGRPPDPFISAAQRGRLFALAGQKGWTSEAMKPVMLKRWNLDSSSKITKAQYDEVVGWFEKNPPPAAEAPAAPAPTPEGAIGGEENLVTIADVVTKTGPAKPDGSPSWTVFNVVTSDGAKCSTLDQKIGEAAILAKAEGYGVRVVTVKAKTKSGYEYNQLKEISR